MPNKMLIDAAHPEETRVVVLRGNRVEEFDFESASKRQLRGNIYLAKVTRVEPSLQAAFIEYGGNRHGFLAFSEIHPDYYQIPIADRQALLEDEARAQAQEEDEERGTSSANSNSGGGGGQQRRGRRRRPERFQRRRRPDEAVTGDAGAIPVDDENAEGAPIAAREDGEAREDTEHQPGVEAARDDHGHAEQDAGHDHDHAIENAVAEHHEHETAPAVHEHAAEASEHHGDDNRQPSSEEHRHETGDAIQASRDESQQHRVEEARGEAEPQTSESHAAEPHVEEHAAGERAPEADVREIHSANSTPESRGVDDDEDDDEEAEEEIVEHVGGADALEELPRRAPRSRRQYKIQEVIKRRQVLLVQVVKEERGSKGAALTTYLSLAGRYSVLMPNTARGGGISRKITDAQDRRRLKEIASELEVPEGMGVILRTAGASRTTGEVKRDFEYLMRMWESVRELTLKSTAPCLVYEEGSLIKRSIRDLYSKEIDEVAVAGDAGFAEARDYMRMLMPSHEKNVRQWREPSALFVKSGVESQLDAMFSNTVTLKSGGYLVINQAEALVAIDVNSGRSTREHNIEDTALRTNLEAADEVARQLRLRDLAGLIVVDFIDMEENRNNRSVERRLKDALKNDRARIQVGRISHFGLLEMSRQRMRTGVLEGSTVLCPHCAGTGQMRATSSIALHTLRAIEETLARSATHNVVVRARAEVALYILNHKRASLIDIESRFGVAVIVAADDTLAGMTYYAIERGELAAPPQDVRRVQSVRIDSIAPAPEYEEPIEDEADAGGERDEPETDGVEPAEGTAEDSEERHRRKRRRRRGRGDREGGGFQGANEQQPADSGLEFMARVGGDLPPPGAEAPGGEGETADGEAAETDQPEVGGFAPRGEGGPRPRGRRRRGGGGRWSEREPRNAATETSTPADAEPASGEAPAETPDLRGHWTREEETPAHAAFEPAAEHHELAVHQAPDSRVAEAPPAEGTVEPVEPPRAPEPPSAYSAPLPEAAVDPERPKRSGWWQRAKQTLGGS